MKKKIVSLLLIVALLATAVIGGTLAYFTDTESATNTFTVGSVDIQLLESQYYTNVDTASDEDIRNSAENYDAYLAEQGKNVVPGREFNKSIYIDNTGNNAAYVRVRMFVTRNQFNSFWFYENNTALNNGELTKAIVAHYADGSTLPMADIDAVKADGNWVKLEYIYTYTEALVAGDLTDISPVWKYKMKDLDNEDVHNFTEDDLKIEVYADAIQAEGFESAEAAFAAFVGQEGSAPVDGTPDKSDTTNFEGEYGA